MGRNRAGIEGWKFLIGLCLGWWIEKGAEVEEGTRRDSEREGIGWCFDQRFWRWYWVDMRRKGLYLGVDNTSIGVCI